MKRRFFSVMLALSMCLGLLPSAALAAGEGDGTYSDRGLNNFLGVEIGGMDGDNSSSNTGSDTTGGRPISNSSNSGQSFCLGNKMTFEEGESWGFTVSPHHVSFAPCVEGEETEPVYVTLTNTGDTSLDEYFPGRGYFQLPYSQGAGPIDWEIVEGALNADGELDPGDSITYELTLDTNQIKGSGTLDYNGEFVRFSHEINGFEEWGISVHFNKGGHWGIVPEVLTVDYDVRPLTEVADGDITWDVDTKSIDFGTIDGTEIHYDDSGYEYGIWRWPEERRTITVTNRGQHEFCVESEMTQSGSEVGLWATPKCWVAPGESETINVGTMSDGVKAGTYREELTLTAYYPDTKEKNTLTTTIPVTVTYLRNGGYEIKNVSDNSYGTVKGLDGTDHAAWTSEGRGQSTINVMQGGRYTFVMTPYDPENYCVTDIKLNGKSVGTGGMVNNTYTISDVQENYEFEAVFGPITDPSQRPVGSMTPAAWAAEAVQKAIERGILPVELQGSYDQPITRKDFCALADWCYLKVMYGFPEGEAETFTDCNDFHVRAMSAAGVVTGVGGGAFDPDGQLTREQAATILTRLSSAMGEPLPTGEPTFTDMGQAGAWAYAAIGSMEQSGVMNGTGSGAFSPQQAYTREQSVVTIMRLYEMFK